MESKKEGLHLILWVLAQDSWPFCAEVTLPITSWLLVLLYAGFNVFTELSLSDDNDPFIMLLLWDKHVAKFVSLYH